MTKLITWGINHKTADVSFREKVSITNDEIPVVIEKIQHESAQEALVLSTCNRTEIYAYGDDQLNDTLIQTISEIKNIPSQKLKEFSYYHENMDSAAHLFRVTASIDSMVIGEPEILGQVKQAYQRATELGSIKKVLSTLFQKSFNLAKRIRTETEISSRPTSVGAVGAELAVQIFGNTGINEILFIGAGQMAEVSLKNVIGKTDQCKIMICNRTIEKAQELCSQFQGSALSLDDLDSALESCDIVISSLGTEHAFLHKERLESIQIKRDNRPLFFIDLGVPRNISPDCNTIEDIYIYDMDDLQKYADKNKDYRNSLIETCEPYLNEGIHEFETWFKTLDNQKVIGEVMRRNQEIISSEIQKSINKLPTLNEQESKELHYLLERVVKKVMHPPIQSLRKSKDTSKPNWRNFFLGH